MNLPFNEIQLPNNKKDIKVKLISQKKNKQANNE